MIFFAVATLCSFLSSLLSVQAIPATTDIYYHEKTDLILPSNVWTFGADGVKVYSVDGTQVLKRHTREDLGCRSERGCNYFDVVSDGHKYVWASALHDLPHKIDVFSIETGQYVGGVAACNTPLDLDYVPSREELWVRCAQPDEEDPESGTGHMIVIGSNSLSASSEQVRLSDERQYGYSVFHSSLGNQGFATANDINLLYEIDLAHRTSPTNYTFPEHVHSSYDVTYSPANKHLFIRSRVCCSCGFEGADAGSCGRGPSLPVEVTLGPSAGQTVNGTCGAGCEGSPADLVGVMEFDTVSKIFVADHNIKEGTGFGATPEASPDGKYVVLFPNDGGKNIRVLKTSENGAPSTLAFDVPVGFENVAPDREAAVDFAFVQHSNHNILALTSAADSTMVLIDLSETPPKVRKLQLSPAAEGTGGAMVEWVYGTDYIWVGGNGNNEAFVVELSDDGDIDEAQVKRTLVDAEISKMIHVENFMARKEREAMALLMGEEISSQLSKLTSAAAPATAPSTADRSASSSSSAFTAAAIIDETQQENDDPDPMSVAALIIAVTSILMNAVFILSFTHGKNQVEQRARSSHENTEQAEVATLGSKQVA